MCGVRTILDLILARVVIIESQLVALDQKVDQLMSAAADISKVLNDIDTATNDVAAKIQALLDRLAAGSLTPAELENILAMGAVEVARLKGLAADPNNPVPSPQVKAKK